MENPLTIDLLENRNYHSPSTIEHFAVKVTDESRIDGASAQLFRPFIVLSFSSTTLTHSHSHSHTHTVTKIENERDIHAHSNY